MRDAVLLGQCAGSAIFSRSTNRLRREHVRIIKQLTGICNCDQQCNGKGKNDFCKKITIAVFNSGKIIITGGQSNEHLNTAHKFITDLINEKKKEIMIK